MAKDNGEEYLEKLLGKVNGDFSDDDFLKDIDEDFPELNDQKFMEEFAKDVDKVVVEDFLDKAENSDDSIIDDLKAELEADGVNEQINFEDSRDLSFPEDMDLVKKSLAGNLKIWILIFHLIIRIVAML